MNNLYLIVIAGIALACMNFILDLTKSKKKKGGKDPQRGESLKKEKIGELTKDGKPLYKKKYILTNNEYKFYKALKEYAEEKQLIICPKVGLKDLFEPKAAENKMSLFGRIAQKHIDFLICDKELRPVYGIELDDKSHEREDRQKSDQFKNELFKSCGIPLYRITTKQEYTKADIEEVTSKV